MIQTNSFSKFTCPTLSQARFYWVSTRPITCPKPVPDPSQEPRLSVHQSASVLPLIALSTSMKPVAMYRNRLIISMR
jgi:hypothetical protein